MDHWMPYLLKLGNFPADCYWPVFDISSAAYSVVIFCEKCHSVLYLLDYT